MKMLCRRLVTIPNRDEKQTISTCHRIAANAMPFNASVYIELQLWLADLVVPIELNYLQWLAGLPLRLGRGLFGETVRGPGPDLVFGDVVHYPIC
jgi:hypothetical protein